MTTSPPLPRVCHLQKAFAEQEYGFNLHAQVGRGQYIGSVDADSPADKAGLAQGDRIVGVNGLSVGQLSHKEVVARIKEEPSKCALTVIDEAGEQWYRERDQSVPVDLLQVGTLKLDSGPEVSGQQRKPLPRLCKLTKDYADQEYGFNLHAERNRGHFIGQVDLGSVARRAQLVQGQRIVGVNGTLIYTSTSHREVVRLIKEDPMRVELLVASPEVDEWHRANNVEFNFSQIENAQTPPADMHVLRTSCAQQTVYADDNQEPSALQSKKVKEVTTIFVAPAESTVARQTSPSKDSADAVNNNGVTISSRNDYKHCAGRVGDQWTKLTAAEMRQYLMKNKKCDPRNQPLSMEKKYEIAQNL